jgi:hypothetical protein
MRGGGHEGGARFRGGGDRARLGGHGRGRRFQGSSTIGRVGGDWDLGIATPAMTDTPYRIGGRFRRHGGGEVGFFRGGHRGRRRGRR